MLGTTYRRFAASAARYARRVITTGAPRETDQSAAVAEYWTGHNVTLHHRFAGAEESLGYFHWRNDQYCRYIELMPVAVAPGQSILDFGCGPGHDLVGFGVYAEPRRLAGVDVSSSSLAESRARLALHGITADLHEVDVHRTTLPFEDESFDLVHSSGVIHHMAEPAAALHEIRRVLRPGGRAQIMVYNRQSLWLHLYVAYIRQIVEGQHADLGLEEAFARSTDGPDCPISRCYTRDEFAALAAASGLRLCSFGVAVSVWEMRCLSRRLEAIADQRLPRECREFLRDLTFDAQGLPIHGGYHAGVDGCFVFEAV
jgi:SAM-dependent methyltransferase